MKVFNSINEFRCDKKTILTLGTFDGVHLGHKTIIEKLTQKNIDNQYESLVLTFFPHPRRILDKKSDLKLLNTIEEKIILLANLGLQNLIIHPFDTVFSRLSAEEFVKTILVDRLQIHKIIIGYDHHFGRDRTANIHDLIAFGHKYQFEVEQISAQEINEVSISSTKIRTALNIGNMLLANTFLGYEYFLMGTVVRGKQLGRTLGFPTANLKIEQNEKLIPKNGVYIIKSIIDRKNVLGMMNIGYNPTFNEKQLSIEIHYFDFDADLYERKISVSILEYIREEKKFNSIEALKTQLEKDKQTALNFFRSKY